MPEEINSVAEVILGIEFRKTYYLDNSVKYFINGNEVEAFATDIVGKTKKELIISIVSKADE